MGSHLKPFPEIQKFHEKWTPPEAKWSKLFVGATLPRNVKIYKILISLGIPSPRLDFLTLLAVTE